jgi:hypothetical protein
VEPKVPPFNTNAIPNELKQRRQWICWRYDERDGKTVKVPVAPWKGHNGPVSVTDPDNCADFDTAASYARKNGIGIGFVFFKGSKISGVDFDKPELYPELVEEAKSRSYMERSVSGRGFHTLGYGVLSDAIKRDGLEAYSQDRFFVVTGAHVEGSPLKLDDIQPLLDRLQREYGRNKTATVEVKPQPAAGWEGYVNRLGYTLEEIRDKDKVLDEYLRGGLAGKPSESEADMGTLERLLFWGFEPNEAVAILQHYRWREKLQRRDYVEGMLQKLLPVHERAKPKPKPLDALTETICIGEVEVTPLANTYIPIHPAIGVVDDTAYVGVWLPSSVTYKPKKKDASPKTRVTDLLFLVTDKKELLLANEETLRGRGWNLAFTPVKVKATWKKVIEYLKGNCILDPLQLFSQILTEYKDYIEFPDEREYVLHTLWDMGTYFHVLFNSYPYLYVGGIKRSGKSKVLTMHSILAFNAFFSNNMSTPSIYRLIQNAKGTLLIDETEKLSNPDRALEFRSIILSGYKKGAVVYRIEKTKKETLVPEAFEIYGPKALGNIQGLEDVLEDRCIVTIMKRGKNRKITDREVNVQSEHWSELKHGLHLLFLTFWKEVMEIYRKISEFSELNELVNFLGRTQKNEKLQYLTARELELWKPIFTMAKFLDNYAEKNKGVSNSSPSSPNSLSSLVLDLALDKAEQKQTENVTETGELILAQVLLSLIKEDNYYRVKDIREEMAKQFDEEQKWLTTRWVGNALRRLGFTEKRRVGTGYEYRLTQNDVADLAERLGITPSQPTLLQYEDKLLNIKSCGWDDTLYGEHECYACGYTKLTSWQGETFGGEKVWLCDECAQKWETQHNA